MAEETDRPRLIQWLPRTAGVLVAVAGIAVGAYKYFDTRAFESRRPLLEKQFDLYTEAVETTGRLATLQCAANDQACIEDFRDACHRFQALYWGRLAIVEDKRVELAMIAFQGAFQNAYPGMCEPGAVVQAAISRKPTTTTSGAPARGTHRDGKQAGGDPGRPTVTEASLDLAHCVNASLHDGWSIDLLPDRCDYAAGGGRAATAGTDGAGSGSKTGSGSNK